MLRSPCTRTGGAKGGGFELSPTLEGERTTVATVLMPSGRCAVSVYGALASSRRSRMCSPRPGMPGQ